MPKGFYKVKYSSTETTSIFLNHVLVDIDTPVDVFANGDNRIFPNCEKFILQTMIHVI